jgi:phosphoglycolate phosphatase-like HAD superfamily hydrolase
VTATNAIRTLILDFDGVILESNSIKDEAFREIFAGYPEHFDAMVQYHERHLSAPRRAKFEHLVRVRLGRPDDEPLVESLTAEFSRRVRERLRTCHAVPGAMEFLEEFAGRVPTFLVSVTPEPELLATLGDRNLRRHFTAVYGCPPWTKATAIADLLRGRDGGASGAVLVGDSPSDMRAAQEAGVAFVGRDSGTPFPAPAPALHPDLRAIAAVLRERLAA